MSTRSRARQVVLQMLFQYDLNLEAATEQQHQFISTRLNKVQGLVRFATQLVGGVRSNKDTLDVAVQAAANNWSIPRMAVTDRNILRLGAYELLHTDTPPSVVINEAIELAKRFGSNQSSGFVNGILDRVLESSKPEIEIQSEPKIEEEPSSEPAESVKGSEQTTDETL